MKGKIIGALIIIGLVALLLEVLEIIAGVFLAILGIACLIIALIVWLYYRIKA